MASDTQQDRLLTPGEAAEFLRLKPQTLYKWRQYGKGPAYSKIGYRIVYRQSILERFVRRCQVCTDNTQSNMEV